MTLKNLLKGLKSSEQTTSMILGAVVIVIVGVFIFNYFQRGVSQKPATSEKLIQTEEESPKTEEDSIPEGLPKVHKVSKRERLWDISLLYYGSGYNWVDIASENKLKDPNRLLVDQELTIPKVAVRKPLDSKPVVVQTQKQITDEKYTVLNGDNLWKIAVRTYGDGYKWIQIARANKLINPNLIHPGNTLILPR